jgi:uridylate kinase
MFSLFGDKVDDLLQRAESILPVDNNLITRAIDNLCQVYNRDPQRDIDSKYLDKLKTIDFNDVMDKVHKNAKFIGKCLVRVNYLKDIVLETYTPAYYDVERDVNKDIIKFTLIEYEDTTQKAEI